MCIDVFYHHRASAWGIKIQDNYLITGSMDKTISLINLLTLKVEKHFLAHEDEWGGKLKLKSIFHSCKVIKIIEMIFNNHAFNSLYIFLQFLM